MSRIIKFRVWDISNQLFIGPYTFWDWTYMKGNLFCYTEKYYTIQQFTGIKDRDGVEIYEGDFIKTTLGIKTVIFSNDIASFECVCDKNLGSRCLYGYKKDNDLRVIGNIFENKELKN